MIAPQGKKVAPSGLKPPAGARKRRKASVTKRRNTTPGFNTPDPKLFVAVIEDMVYRYF